MPDPPTDDALEQRGVTVGTIDIRVDDVFDTSLPEEDRWLFRLANRLHPRTRDWVIRQQLLLGGDNGLRDYPLRYQDGDRRVLLTVEQRFYTDWQILRLANVGGALFVDVGRSWFEGSPSAPGTGLLSDIGAGLRLAHTRSGRGTMVHIDVAYPLQRGPDVPGVQLLISTKESF